MSRRIDGRGLQVRFEVHQSDLDAIDPDVPQPEPWQYWSRDNQGWKEAKPAYDPFRRVHYVDYEDVDRFDYGLTSPPIADFTRGELVGFRPGGPTEVAFFVPGRVLSIPGVHTPCWVHVLDPDGLLRSFEVFTTDKTYSGGTGFHGYDRHVPPEPPKPCPRCQKRDAKKGDRKRLKQLRKRYDKGFRTLAEAEAYDDGYQTANDW